MQLKSLLWKRNQLPDVGKP